MGKLVEDLLDVSHISGDKLTLHMGGGRLSALTHDVLRRFGEQAQRAGCTLRTDDMQPAVGEWTPSAWSRWSATS